MNELQAGTVLNNKYTVRRILGHGGVGIVYECREIKSGCLFAVKEVFPSFCERYGREVKVGVRQGLSDIDEEWSDSKDYSMKEKFEQLKRNLKEKASVISKLSDYPEVTTFIDFFEENNTVYMVMELLQDYTLTHYIRRGVNLSEVQIREIGILLIRAVKLLHANGLLHMDICPDNIIVGDRMRLIDFDAVKQIGENCGGEAYIIFRKSYSPPEQYDKANRIGKYTDLYAVGAVLYELTTGKKVPDALSRIREDTLIEPKRIRRDISDDLNYIIMKALFLKSEKRFQDAEEFERALIRDGNAVQKMREMWIRFGIISLACLIFLGLTV